jgi:hypothetical protein
MGVLRALVETISKMSAMDLTAIYAAVVATLAMGIELWRYAEEKLKLSLKAPSGGLL